MPPMKMAKANNLNPIIIYAGIVSNMWYLSAYPSVTLLRRVMMTFTIPSIHARGTYKSKSIEFLKVTVHPYARRSSMTMIAESEMECSSMNMKSKNWYSVPLMYAYMRKPIYLNTIEPILNQRLIFKVHLIQLSPSYYLFLYKNLNI